MNNEFSHNIHIFWALLRKDLKLFIAKFKGILIDCLIPLIANVISFGYLFPLLGMAESLVAPTFLGMNVMLFISLGFSLAQRIQVDLEYKKFIDYQITLPIPKRWLFFEYITYFTIELMGMIFPLTVFGIMLLGNRFITVSPNWIIFLPFFILSSLFFALFFMAISFRYPYIWWKDNIWTRRLMPLFCLGCVFFVWQKLYAFSPFLGIVFLLNPITYVAEGFRACLIGGNEFLPISLCTCILVIYMLLFCFVLKNSIFKRIDPV